MGVCIRSGGILLQPVFPQLAVQSTHLGGTFLSCPVVCGDSGVPLGFLNIGPGPDGAGDRAVGYGEA